MLTYADVCSELLLEAGADAHHLDATGFSGLTYADVCCRMLTYALSCCSRRALTRITSTLPAFQVSY
jgi:hypothetical protein